MMFEKQIIWLKKFLTFGSYGGLINVNVRRTIFINLFSLLGLFFFVLFFVYGYDRYEKIYLIDIAVFFVALLITYLLYKIFAWVDFVAYSLVVLMFFFNISLLLVVDTAFGGILWIYVFPILAILMLGRNKGLFLSVLLFVVIFLLIRFHLCRTDIDPNKYLLRMFVTYMVVLMLTYSYEFIRERTFRALQTVIKERDKLIDQITIKQEELLAQSEELTRVNQELEKLSLVARETNNSIVIADKNFQIIWINKAFRKMYGYTLYEYKKKCKNIIECSEKSELLRNAIEHKQSVEYISIVRNKQGQTIWVQTNMTPILDSVSNIKYVIFLQSDITKLIVFENEILEKNNELVQQKEEILAQKMELARKNDIISHYNKTITESIYFAESIQKAIFPTIELLNKVYENFIIFQPKDIISGDFYWFQETPDSFLVAVADCTGHGVAGAFMTIVGTRIINEIVHINKVYSPSGILDKLDLYWRKSINQTSIENEEGMDLIIARIYKNVIGDKKIIEYCGAKRPLIYFDASKKDVFMDRGIRKGIGGKMSPYNLEKFFDSRIELSLGSVLYLTTDGFIDQHNNERRKIGTAKLLSVLRSISDLPLNKQKMKLLLTFELHKEDQAQTDDMTIFAIKLA